MAGNSARSRTLEKAGNDVGKREAIGAEKVPCLGAFFRVSFVFIFIFPIILESVILISCFLINSI